MPTAPTTEGIVESARMMLRDFPRFFEVDHGPLYTSTIRLPHPLVDGSSLQVYAAPQPGPDTMDTPVPLTAVTEWTCDGRNGLLKFNDATYQGQRVVIAGYHYEWFLNEDLEYSVSQVVAEHTFQRHDITSLAQLSTVELDVIAMGAVVRSLWWLVTEFSTDIDVNSPEGMFIPARQRYQQVWQMLEYWEKQYDERAKSLNVGLQNIDVFVLRREAKMTGRLVPIYRPREDDDHSPPERVYPQRPTYTTTEPGTATSGTDVSSVEEIGREAADLGFGGWQSGGTNGGI